MEAHGYHAVEFEQAVFLRARPAVAHLHWPEGAVLHKSLLKSLWRLGLFMGLVSLCRLRRIPLVWTAHNTRSHDHHHPHMESFLRGFVYRHLAAVITLKPVAGHPELTTHPALRGKPFHHIPHGEFASYYRAYVPSGAPLHPSKTPPLQNSTPPPSPFLVFGHIRPYKKVPDILRTFRTHPDPQMRLVIAGRSLEPALTTEIEALVAADARVTFRNELIPDAEVAPLFETARALVLAPDPSKNSGILHLAASFSLPVVHLAGDRTAWNAPESLPPPPAWPELAAAHAEVFGRLRS